MEDLERDNDIIDSEIDKVESKSLDSSVIKVKSVSLILLFYIFDNL